MYRRLNLEYNNEPTGQWNQVIQLRIDTSSCELRQFNEIFHSKFSTICINRYSSATLMWLMHEREARVCPVTRVEKHDTLKVFDRKSDPVVGFLIFRFFSLLLRIIATLKWEFLCELNITIDAAILFCHRSQIYIINNVLFKWKKKKKHETQFG